MKNYAKFDEKVARSLQNQLNCTGITENAVFPKEREEDNYRPRTLIDETLEYIDPTPNIYTLFVQFNEKFFWNTLLPVQVKWSPRMTSCAGICSFHPRNKECVIALSTPLLKLRPRKDLVETLLHEMIHAYLFLTNDNRDRDGHGPVFQSHMHRINKAAGTKITIYHTFHEEVKLYQQHWWRCSGPCQKRAPYFGMVRRAMNRAPGPNDFWWAEHQATCAGQFVKIKEPEKPEKKKNLSSQKRNSITSKSPEKNSILNWVKRPAADAAANKQSKNNSNSAGLKKLGNSTNNVHGWGTAGPNAASASNNNPNKLTVLSKQPLLSFSGTCGGSSTGRSNLLDKYSSPSTSIQQSPFKVPALNVQKPIVSCPSCQKDVEETVINQHLDECLLISANEPKVLDENNRKRKSQESDRTSSKIFKSDKEARSSAIECPLCSIKINLDAFNEHLDICASNNAVVDLTDDVSPNDTSTHSVNLQDSPHVCLICDKVLEPNLSLNQHLEDCVSSVFNDSNDDDDDDVAKEVQTNEKEKLLKYPCPVCMTLVDETAMNSHLDTCLK